MCPDVYKWINGDFVSIKLKHSYIFKSSYNSLYGLIIMRYPQYYLPIITVLYNENITLVFID